MATTIEKWNRAVAIYPDFALFKKAIWSDRLEQEVPRGILWKVLLVYGTSDQGGWSAIDIASRDRYHELVAKYDIQEPTDHRPSLDPLTEYHQEPTDTRDIIEQDVLRTFPEMSFFRDSKIQAMLKRMLFIYSKVDSIGYRQGMHELAGPVLYVMAQDQAQDLEADAYTVFESIMKHARSWYKPSDSPDHPPSIVMECQDIQENIIRDADEPLYHLLKDNEIEPQIWGIRYIRLMFGREFDFETSLKLWDALFAADETLQLVDYICAVMLIRVRNKLFSLRSHSDLLSTLMHYPTTRETPYHYVANALYLRDNPGPEGGQHVAKQYANLWSSHALNPEAHRSQSPRIKFDLLSAARNVSQAWDMDKFKDALDGTRKRASRPFHSPSASVDMNPQDRQLAEMLSTSIKSLESLISSPSQEVQSALDGIKAVRDTLLDPARLLTTVSAPPSKPISPEPKSPTTSSQTALRASNSITQTIAKSKAHSPSPSRRRIAQSEYSWMLGDEQKKQEKTSGPSDPFEL